MRIVEFDRIVLVMRRRLLLGRSPCSLELVGMEDSIVVEDNTAAVESIALVAASIALSVGQIVLVGEIENVGDIAFVVDQLTAEFRVVGIVVDIVAVKCETRIGNALIGIVVGEQPLPVVVVVPPHEEIAVVEVIVAGEIGLEELLVE